MFFLGLSDEIASAILQYMYCSDLADNVPPAPPNVPHPFFIFLHSPYICRHVSSLAVVPVNSALQIAINVSSIQLTTLFAPIFCRGSDDAWLACRRPDTSTSWAASGLIYTNWHTIGYTEPNDNHLCVRSTNTGYKDVRCTYHHSVYCRKLSILY